ncbi:MAG: S8 family serine peptidase, partial [Pseudorhodoplanes sp.]|nr:S8 family serine peptidase [Pseudorhodoplanes sp.]
DQVLVAVIDSGVDTTHQEFAGVIADTYDVLDPAEPPHAHGTAIAGAIAAHSRLMGVAPAAKILAIRAFGESKGAAEGTTFNILKSINWAVEKNAHVINMSFAGPQDPALSRSLAAARQKGIVLIAAVGNAGPKSPPLYPAADANVIAVTATDSDDQLFRASNRGGHIAVAAPGVDILLPSPGGGYQVSSGTSFAAAHVSGIAALVLERKRDLKPDAMRKILTSSAKDLGPKGRDIYFGAGLADAYQALTAIEGGDSSPSNASASR